MNRDESTNKTSFFRSPIGLVLIGFLIVAAFFLIAEHRAHIFTGNWFIWLLPLSCLVMHFFHGGHGGGSGGHDHGERPSDSRKEGKP